MLIDSILTDEIIQKLQQPFIFLFNKQDKDNTYDKDELIKDLGIENKKYKNKIIYKETSGFTGQGLKETIDQLTDQIFS